MYKISRHPNPSINPTLLPTVSSLIVPMVFYGVYGPVTTWKTGI